MAIFDINKDELLGLSDTLLEELIARLAEAEVAACGHSPARVRWSGSINAPDGGIDVHVQVPVEQLNSGYIERPDTVFQAKKHRMRRADILREMAPSGVLSPMISGQATKGEAISLSVWMRTVPPLCLPNASRRCMRPSGILPLTQLFIWLSMIAQSWLSGYDSIRQ